MLRENFPTPITMDRRDTSWAVAEPLGMLPAGRKKTRYFSYPRTDLEEAIAFYRDRFGLAFQFTSPEHGYASFAAGAVRLGMALPGADHADLVGRHTGVGLEVADLAAEHAPLGGLGVHFTMPPTRQPWGGLMAMISEADGNVFYLDQVSAAHG